MTLKEVAQKAIELKKALDKLALTNIEVFHPVENVKFSATNLTFDGIYRELMRQTFNLEREIS